MRRALIMLVLAALACNYPGLQTEPATPPPAQTSAAPTPIPTVAAPTEVAYTPQFEPGACPASVPAQGYTVECGTLIVPQDRTQPGGVQVRLPVVIYRGADSSLAPVLHLSGGPGSEALPLAGYHLNTGHGRLLTGGDYILFEQRGVGLAEPNLACPERTALSAEFLADPPPDEEVVARSKAAYDRCLARLLAEGIDPEQYHSAASAADVRDLIAVLGYERVNLYGVSYGTRLALTVMRDHPEIVRSAVLDSPYPPQVNLYDSWTRGAQRAFEAVFAACAADSGCNSAYPDLQARFYALVDRLEAAPLTVPVTDPLTGGTVNAQLDGALFVDVVFLMMYRWDNITLVPRLIADVEAGRVTDYLVSRVGLYVGGGGSAGMTISVQCNEELAFSSPEALRAISAGVPEAINGAYFPAFDLLYSHCATWTPAAPDPIENEPVTSDLPTLILTGELDPITPPQWGPLTAETLPNATVLAFPAVGHWVIRSGERGTCAMDVMLRFLQNPQAPPDAACVEGLPGVRFALP